MKAFLKRAKGILLPLGVFLGVLIIVNLFLPSETMEGFKEGATTSTTSLGSNQKCTQATQKCVKTIRDNIVKSISEIQTAKTVDENFKNGAVTSKYTKDFNKKYKVDLAKNINCKDFAECEFNKPASASAPAPAPAPAATSPSTSPASTTQPTNSQIMDAINNLSNQITTR